MPVSAEGRVENQKLNQTWLSFWFSTRPSADKVNDYYLLHYHYQEEEAVHIGVPSPPLPYPHPPALDNDDVMGTI